MINILLLGPDGFIGSDARDYAQRIAAPERLLED
jgi:hypothetical protein